MSVATRLIQLFGSAEDAGETQNLTAGPLSLDINGGKLRNIQWYGVELIRAIDTPIRDRNWGTVPVTITEEKAEQTPDGWTYSRLFTSNRGQISGGLQASGDCRGNFSVEVSFTASADFETARAGFTLLHPIKGLAGEVVEVSHSDSPSEKLAFPLNVAPSQPVRDITGLTYAIAGCVADIHFEGEIFEMEDQRNWTDASYKTYCRPLGWPCPYTLHKGKEVRQKIIVTCSGDFAPGTSNPSKRVGISNASQADERVPDVLLALESDFLPTDTAMPAFQNLGVSRVSIRVKTVAECKAVLAPIKKLDLAYDLEVVLPDDKAAATELLRAIARLCSEQKTGPSHVIGVPEAYMKSYQPDGDWPIGLTPQECVALCRETFTDAKIGGGVLTNFTEFNRCHPDPDECDYGSFATTAIVHAADDQSVFETLEAQPDVYASAQSLMPKTGYRMGLVGIGFRSNPYGSAPLENPEQVRLEMTQADPRQRGLFAASWMVGAVATTQGFHIESLALAMPVGPLGLIYRQEDYAQPLFDNVPGRIIYPAYHVVKALAEFSGKVRQSVTLPDGLFGVVTKTGKALKAVISNGTSQVQFLELPSQGRTLLMSEDTFDAATADLDWLKNASRENVRSIELSPYAVAFIDFIENP